MNRPKTVCLIVAALGFCLNLSGCRSAFVEASIVNHTGSPVRLVELDYPSASFGTQQIASDSTFKYRFKIQDSGPVTISFTGADNKIHTSSGPALTQGQQGGLTVTLGNNDSVTWSPQLSQNR